MTIPRRPLAVGAWVLMLLGVGTTAALQLSGPGAESSDAGTLIVILLIPLVYGTAGLILTHRVPANRIGWVFLVGGALFAVWTATYSYMNVGLPADWPGVSVAAWVNFTIYMPAILALVALPLLLFPDGRVPSPGWRWVLRVVMTFGVSWVILQALTPEYTVPLEDTNPKEISPRYEVVTEEGEPAALVENPIGWQGLRGLQTGLPGLLFLALLGSSFLGPAAAMAFRFWRSAGVERLQLKWLAYSASIAAFGLGVLYTIQEMSPGLSVLGIVEPVALLGVLGIPITAGLAVARYRLYDIDRIVSRTVTYAVVVGLLLAVYAGAVTLLTQVLPIDSNLPIAVSALAAAALFNPFRRRIQHRVDRRFNRTRYEAQRELEAFTARLRGTTDAGEVQADLTDVIDRTLQPSQVGLWIRDPE